MTEVKDVLADRDGKYGKFADVAATSRQFRHITGETVERKGTALADDQVEALAMIYMKIARIINGNPDYADNWIDIAGYATLVANRLEGKT